MSAKPDSDTFDPFIAKIAEAVAERMAKTPVAIFEAEMARRLAASLHDDQSAQSQAKFGVGHNRGPPMPGLGRPPEEPVVMTIPEFCAWAKISRSLLYQLWETGTGPKFIKLGVSTRITREAAQAWLVERQASASV